MRDVARVHGPVRGSVYELSLWRRARLGRRERLAEVPDPDGAGRRIPVVLGDHVTVAVVGVSRRAGRVEEGGLLSGGQVDDHVVDVVDAVDLLLDQEPLTALVDLTFVEVAGFREERELA